MANQNTIQLFNGAPTPAQGANYIPAYVPADSSAHILTNQPGNPATMYVGQGTLAGGTAQPSYAVQWDGKPFRLRVYGKVTCAASCSMTIAFHVGTTSTYTAGQLAATSGSISIGGSANSTSFMLFSDILWDSVGQKLRGTLGGYVNATLIAAAAVTNAVAVTTQAGLTFQLAVTFSDQTAGTELTITEFTCEPI